MNWCRGLHKPVRLGLTRVTHCTCRHTNLNGIMFPSHKQISCKCFVLYTQTAQLVLSLAPDLVKPGNHLCLSPSILFINPSVLPPSHPSIYIGLCLSSSARPLAFLHSQNIMTDGDGAPINVSLFLFFILLHFFHSISV